MKEGHRQAVLGSGLQSSIYMAENMNKDGLFFFFPISHLHVTITEEGKGGEVGPDAFASFPHDCSCTLRISQKL